MNRRYGWARWLTWWHRPAVRAKGPDFGDYGTAFGLDLSLEDQCLRQQPGATAATERPTDTALHAP